MRDPSPCAAEIIAALMKSPAGLSVDDLVAYTGVHLQTVRGHVRQFKAAGVIGVLPRRSLGFGRGWTSETLVLCETLFELPHDRVAA